MTVNKISKLEEEIQAIELYAGEIVIDSDESLTEANEFLRGVIKELRRQVKDTFDPIIKKTNEAHKEAVSQKKKFDGPLTFVENAIKQKIASYLRKLEQKRLEAAAEQARLEAERNKALAEGKEEVPPAPEPAPLPPPAPKLEGTSVVKVWKWEITDLNAIPIQYMTVDNGAVNTAVRNGIREIPGIRIFQEEMIRTRV